jgi:hypothetical protein
MSRKLIRRIGAFKVYRDSDWQEYVVKREGDATGAADYFTSDKADAIATAEAMHGREVLARRATETNPEPTP